jgi:hypothetical protein
VKTKTGEVIVKKNHKFTRGAIKKLEAAKIKTLPLDKEELLTKVCANDMVDEATGEVLDTFSEPTGQLTSESSGAYHVLDRDNHLIVAQSMLNHSIMTGGRS